MQTVLVSHFRVRSHILLFRGSENILVEPNFKDLIFRLIHFFLLIIMEGFVRYFFVFITCSSLSLARRVSILDFKSFSSKSRLANVLNLLPGSPCVNFEYCSKLVPFHFTGMHANRHA